MIATFRNFGTGIIEDVVINHRDGVSTWTDFPTETYKGVTYEWGPWAICSNDEVAGQAGQEQPTGAPDTGDNTILFVIAMGVALTCAVVVVARKRRA